ncbi:MAG: mammalian cell entry protein [Verrucomicrobiales bacterium]|nr:mammalian cell entry protein [Verrucomicrobiales bacterium]|tara:strand:+ start:11952 stop:13007 length:1056 start_codon:yes stop_codon:yes gene_type:complete
MKGSLETRLGVFFAMVALAAVLLIELSGGTDVFKKGYELHALFRRTQQLKVGDPVKMAGVRIGRVSIIDFEGSKVKVTMKIDDHRKVKTDSEARIQAAGLVGENFVSLTFGSPESPNLEANSNIETVEQADLNAIMTKLDNVAGGIENLTKSFSGDSIQNVLGPLTDFMNQNNPKITAILGDLQVVSKNMAEGRGTLGRFMGDDTLYTEATQTMKSLNETATEAKTLLADAKGSLDNVTGTFTEAKNIFGDLKLTLSAAQDTLNKVNQGEGSLGKLLHDESLYSETTLAMSNLREIFEKINKGQGSAGKLVNDENLYSNAKMTLQKIDKATEGLEDQGPLSILGTAVNRLF